MDELQIPEEGEPLLTFRVGVDFRVGARDAMEARALVERTLSAEDSDGTPFVSRTHRIIDDQSWGVSDWQQVPPRPSQAALVQEKYPGLVSDLAVIEGLGVRGNTPGALPEQTRERIREVLASLDCFVFAEDPGRSGGPRIFEGAASTAAGELAEGVYRAFDYDDREYALVVAPSELTPSGRVSAAIPKERNDARALDEISRLLEQHTRRQPLSELVRQVSRRMNTTRRAGFPSWIPLESEPERPPRPPARVPVGVIVWSDLDGVEPTVLADTSAARLARTIATTLHETLSDSDAFAGATEFLTAHTAPADWQYPEDVDAWLNALLEATPYPSFSIQSVPLGPTILAGAPASPELTQALDQRAQDLSADTEPGPAASGREPGRAL